MIYSARSWITNVGCERPWPRRNKPSTTFVGYEATAGTARVVALVRDGRRLPEAREGEDVDVVLDATPFYGEAGGQVIIQTYNPDHYALKAAREHDYAAFYEREIEYRRELGYPPFSRLALFRLSGKDRKAVAERARSLADEIRDRIAGLATSKAVEILGPSPALVSRVRGRFRWNILLKSPRPEALHSVIESLADSIASGRGGDGVRVSVDIDPATVI